MNGADHRPHFHFSLRPHLLNGFAYMITTACEPVVAQIHLNLLADIVTYPEIESAMVTVPETRLNPLSTTVCVSFQRS